jgi:hypothetical protein
MRLDDIPGKQSSAELRKTAILGTAHFLRKTLTLKSNVFSRRFYTMNLRDKVCFWLMADDSVT